MLTRAANYLPGSRNHQGDAPLLLVIAELHTHLDERFEHGGWLPFGYAFQDGAFCVNHDQAATVPLRPCRCYRPAATPPRPRAGRR
ncbi:MAG: hypothetical protein HC884_18965, partial [Chloroflexaceae bacterium]|nr:hypothetical protein [Chloroflexaceae bacterium]